MPFFRHGLPRLRGFGLRLARCYPNDRAASFLVAAGLVLPRCLASLIRASRSLSASRSVAALPRLHEAPSPPPRKPSRPPFGGLLDDPTLIGLAAVQAMPGAPLEAALHRSPLSARILASPRRLNSLSRSRCARRLSPASASSSVNHLTMFGAETLPKVPCVPLGAPKTLQGRERLDPLLQPCDRRALPKLPANLSARRVVFVRPFPARCRPTTRADYTHLIFERKRKKQTM